jgi:hypothetical protein
MRVKIQLVVCTDEGWEETMTDIVTLKKNCQRIEHGEPTEPGISYWTFKEKAKTAARQ